MKSQELRKLAPELDSLRLGSGWSIEDLSKPQIIVESSYGHSHPGSAHLNKLVEEGKSIIMISSEMTEILRMSDRIVVMCEGKKTGELDISEAKQETIMNLATREIE